MYIYNTVVCVCSTCVFGLLAGKPGGALASGRLEEEEAEEETEEEEDDDEKEAAGEKVRFVFRASY